MSRMLLRRGCASSPSPLELLLRRRSRPLVPRTALQMRTGGCVLATGRTSCRHVPNGYIIDAVRQHPLMRVLQGDQSLNDAFIRNNVVMRSVGQAR